MDLNYYRMSPMQRFIHKITDFFKNFGKRTAGFFVNIYKAIVAFFVRIGHGFAEFGKNFWYGDALTKASHFLIGLRHIIGYNLINKACFIMCAAVS